MDRNELLKKTVRKQERLKQMLRLSEFKTIKEEGMKMGPGREPKVCENEELVDEFELACRAGDAEFADGYKAEIIRRLSMADKGTRA